MISKLETGNGFRGALRYDVRSGKGTPKELARALDACGVSFDFDDKGNLLINPKQVGFDFRQQTMGYTGKGVIRKPVYHWVLSYHPDDKVSEEQMIEDAKDFLKRVGFGDTQYVMTVHYDKKHHHLHIVTNIVDNQGKRIPTMGLIDKAHEAAAAITKERGYTWGAEQEKSNEKEEEKEKGNETETETETEENNIGTKNKKTKDKKEKEKIHNPHDRARIIVKTVVKEAKSRATSLDEFKNILESQGVSCKVKLANDGERGGISYSIKYEDRVHPFRGSTVGRELSYKYIVEAIGENARRAEEAETAEKLRTYRTTWYEQLAPLYDRSFKVCSELYKSKREVWDRILEENQEIKERFAQIADLNAYNEELKKKLFAAQTSSELMSFIGFLLFFINPLAAIALLAMEKCVNEANYNSNIAERRAVRTEMTRLFNEIGAIKKEQTALRNEAKELVKDYKESVEEKKIFDDAYKAIKEHMAVPIIAEKFDNISKFFPEAKKVIEGSVKKSNNGYDMFFINVDGQKHVAAELDGKVVASVETIDGPFYVNKLQWKDEKGKEYVYGNGKLKEKLQEQPKPKVAFEPNPDAPANIQTTAAPIHAQEVTEPEPKPFKEESMTPDDNKRKMKNILQRYAKHVEEKERAQKDKDAQQSTNSLSGSLAAYLRKNEILEVFKQSADEDCLKQNLAEHGLSMSVKGVEDITITAGGKTPFSIDASKFGQEYLQKLLYYYQAATMPNERNIISHENEKKNLNNKQTKMNKGRSI